MRQAGVGKRVAGEQGLGRPCKLGASRVRVCGTLEPDAASAAMTVQPAVDDINDWFR